MGAVRIELQRAGNVPECGPWVCRPEANIARRSNVGGPVFQLDVVAQARCTKGYRQGASSTRGRRCGVSVLPSCFSSSSRSSVCTRDSTPLPSRSTRPAHAPCFTSRRCADDYCTAGKTLEGQQMSAVRREAAERKKREDVRARASQVGEEEASCQAEISEEASCGDARGPRPPPSLAALQRHSQKLQVCYTDDGQIVLPTTPGAGEGEKKRMSKKNHHRQILSPIAPLCG